MESRNLVCQNGKCKSSFSEKNNSVTYSLGKNPMKITSFSIKFEKDKVQ